MFEVQLSSAAHADPSPSRAVHTLLLHQFDAHTLSPVQANPFAALPQKPSMHSCEVQASAAVHGAPSASVAVHVPDAQ